jgi:hypothetical protein
VIGARRIYRSIIWIVDSVASAWRDARICGFTRRARLIDVAGSMPSPEASEIKLECYPDAVQGWISGARWADVAAPATARARTGRNLSSCR